MPIKRWREFHRTPKDPVHQVVLDAAKGATKSLHITAYGLTLDDLGTIVIDKHKAGLEVGVVADKTQSGGHAQHALLQRMVDAGVPVTIATAPTGAINHEKALIIDVLLGADSNKSYAVYGSWNMSFSADKQENHAQLDNDPIIVADLYAQYIEAQEYGAKHCKQLSPTAAEAPTVPADVVAATEAPPIGPPDADLKQAVEQSQ